MIHKLENDIEYCDCLDWDESSKQRQLRGSTLFNYKLHTTGVTLLERQAWYVVENQHTPQETELLKQLSTTVKE